jgi:hypothetical protein
MREQMTAELSSFRPEAEGEPRQQDRIDLIDPNTQELVCSLTFRDAVVLAFEIEQVAARLRAREWARETLRRDRES